MTSNQAGIPTFKLTTVDDVFAEVASPRLAHRARRGRDHDHDLGPALRRGDRPGLPCKQCYCYG